MPYARGAGGGRVVPLAFFDTISVPIEHLHQRSSKTLSMVKRILLSCFLLSTFFVLNIRSSSGQSSLTADTPWPMYQHDLQHTGRSPFAGPQHKPVLLWTNAKPLDNSLFYGAGGISIAPDGNLILSERSLTKYDPINRQQIWRYTEAGGWNRSFPLIAADSSIYWPYENNIARVNQAGQADWVGIFGANYAQNSSPQFTSSGDILYMIDGLWSISQQGLLNWMIPFSSWAGGVPAIDSNGVIYATGPTLNDSLCAYTALGAINWCKSLPGAGYDVTPAIGPDGSVYVTLHEYLNKISPAGELLWSFAADPGQLGNTYFTRGMAIAPSGVVYAYFNRSSNGSILYAISPDGKLQWQRTFLPNPVTGSNAEVDHPLLTDRNGNIFFCAYNSHCYGVGPQGDLLWNFEFPLIESIAIAGVIQPVLLKDGILWLMDNHGAFYALADPQMAPVLDTSLETISIAVDPGSNGADQAIKVTSSIPGFPYRVEAPAESWVAPGALAGTTDGDLILHINTSALAEGIYHSTIVIKPDGWIGNDVALPITVSIGMKQFYLPVIKNDEGKTPRILYKSMYFKDTQIASISPQGTDRTAIITGLDGYQLDDQFFSPDGKNVVFWVYQSPRHYLRVLDTVTGKITHVYNQATSLPFWSGDSSQLVFTSGQNGNVNIYIWNLISDQVKQVTNSTAQKGDVIWSPDGEWLAYTTDGWNAGMIRADGSGAHLLPNPRGFYNLPIQWSPDSRYVYTLSSTNCCDPLELWRYDTLTKTNSFVSAQQIDGLISNRKIDIRHYLTFSPDGKRIAFVGKSDVFLMNLDGSQLQNLTLSPQIESSPSWSPDGQSLVFARRENNSSAQDDLYTIRVDGTNLTKITNNVLFDSFPFWTQ